MRVPVLLLVLAWPVLADPGLFDWGWRAPLATPTLWAAQPGWVGNADPGARVARDGDALRFHVPAAGKGMKWSLAGADAAIADAPYLLLEYRAKGLRTTSTDYFVYIEDGGKRETRAVRLNALVADGEWHTLVADLRKVAESASFSTVAIQVQARDDSPADVWIRALRQVVDVPDGAGEAAVAAAPDALLPVADSQTGDWVARPSWLGIPDGKPTNQVTEGTVRLAVSEAGRGMKWSWFLPEETVLTGHRFLSFRYRAKGVASGGDYTLAVLGKATADGRDYAKVLLPTDLKMDGMWHVVCADLAMVSKDFPRIKGVAAQVVALAPGASLEIREIGLVSQRAPEQASAWFADAPPTRQKGLEPIPLPATGRAKLAEALAAARVTDWPTGRREWHGIPFELPETSAPVPVTGVRERAETEFAVGNTCSQVFALSLVMLRGAEEEVYARNGNLTEIREIDRFRARLDYADGSSEECVPLNVTHSDFVLRDGAQVLCFFADPSKGLSRITLVDNSPGLGLTVAAVTACTGPGKVPNPDDLLPAFLQRPLQRRQLVPAVQLQENMATVHLPLGTAVLALAPLPRLVSMRNEVAEDDLLTEAQPQPLFKVRVDGEPVPPENFRLEEARTVRGQGGARTQLRYSCTEPTPLTLVMEMVPTQLSELGFRNVALVNDGDQEHRLAIEGPLVGPFKLGQEARNTYYLYPRVGACLHNRETYRRDRFGGRFPVQFMAAFNPVANSGLYLRTEAEREMRDYALGKNRDGVSFGVHYLADIPTPPGKSLRMPATCLGFSEGHWRRGMSLYRKWLASRYHLPSPRQPWFLEVFNFRQRFLHAHDPLYDQETGRYRLDEAVAEGQKQFGGIEYLHIFDWGNVPGVGRVYGRTGDHSPFDGTLKGGVPAFRKAIAGVQKQGVRAGLYIEGYLLQEKGKLGAAHGADWQIVQRNGERMYWPGSTEMMICAAVPEWRQVQASTYTTRVQELGVDGMYMDQFGFANSAKDCWSSTHGHPVPGYTVGSEYGFAQLLRQSISSVKPSVALYSEEVPCDVNSGTQDGAFSYHMKSCRQTRPLVPIHVPRFLYPGFKTFEILVCDRPTGGWAEGVKWTFFNGEGIWLEGPAATWFRPETLAAIRRCHGILREHRDAFSSPLVEPLIDTGVPGVFANAFRKGNKTVYTLYNTRHRTFRGTIKGPRRQHVLRVRDLWRDAEVTPLADGLLSRLPVDLPPRGVGCLMVVR